MNFKKVANRILKRTWRFYDLFLTIFFYYYHVKNNNSRARNTKVFSDKFFIIKNQPNNRYHQKFQVHFFASNIRKMKRILSHFYFNLPVTQRHLIRSYLIDLFNFFIFYLFNFTVRKINSCDIYIIGTLALCNTPSNPQHISTLTCSTVSYSLCFFQKEYIARFPRGAIPVEPNDVFFAIHAVLLTVVQIAQCFIYEVLSMRHKFSPIDFSTITPAHFAELKNSKKSRFLV